MCHHTRHGRPGSSRRFTIVEVLNVGEIDTLPKDEEATPTENNA
jgi:hypothetical protein